MGYGHGSWIPIVAFGGMFLVRYLSSQRRRRGPPARPGPRRPFTGTGSRGRPGRPHRVAPGSDGGPSAGMPAGWFRDPFVRHEQRYWSGTEWTDHVLDDGVPEHRSAARPLPTPGTWPDARPAAVG